MHWPVSTYVQHDRHTAHDDRNKTRLRPRLSISMRVSVFTSSNYAACPRSASADHPDQRRASDVPAADDMPHDAAACASTCSTMRAGCSSSTNTDAIRRHVPTNQPSHASWHDCRGLLADRTCGTCRACNAPCHHPTHRLPRACIAPITSGRSNVSLAGQDNTRSGSAMRARQSSMSS